MMELTRWFCRRRKCFVLFSYISLQLFAFYWIRTTEPGNLSHQNIHSRQTSTGAYSLSLSAPSWETSTLYGKNRKFTKVFIDGVIDGLSSTAILLAEEFIIVRALVVRSRHFCNNSVIGLAQHSVMFKNVIIHSNSSEERLLSTGAGLGEDNDSPHLKRGLLTLSSQCDVNDLRRMISRRGRWERNWHSYIVLPQTDAMSFEQSWSVGVVLKRFEYANVYWTILDLYNVFLALRLYEEPPETAAIILADDHPTGPLDPIWEIFSYCQRLTHLQVVRLHVHSLIWMSHREYDPILQSELPIPLFAEFRNFVHRRVGLTVKSKNRCKASRLKIVIIFRAYLLNKTQQSNKKQRTILNQDAVINATRTTFPTFNVRGVHLESIHVKQQLELISETDILIGVHGAGLAYCAFLQPGAAILELFPKRYIKEPNNHMEILARANGVLYHSWYNRESALEDDADSISLPVQHFVGMVTRVIRKFCKAQNE